MKPELSIATRTLLLERLKDLNDGESWNEFAATYREFIRRLALRARLSESEAEEVVQEVLISVARNIHGFKYDRSVSSFRHWLSNVVRWRISDQRRRAWRYGLLFPRSVDDATRRTDTVHRVADPVVAEPGAETDHTWGERLLAAALERAKSQVSSKQYQIYFLHVLREQPVPTVCHRLKVNRGQVYLAKYRVGRLIEKELRRLTGIKAEPRARAKT